MTVKSGPWILGISASHNGAVCLLRDDEIVVAIQEERLTRRKRDYIYCGQPALALDYCLSYAGIRPQDLSMIVRCIPNPAKDPRQDVLLNPMLEAARHNIPVLTIPHHYGHALSAFATSGFSEAALLVIDGAGSPFEDLFENEQSAIKQHVNGGYETISLYAASESSITPLEKQMVEHGDWLGPDRLTMPEFGSLGGMYSAAAVQIFGDLNDAGKVMGLAPYGKPEIPAPEFFDVVDGLFVFRDHVPRRFADAVERWPMHADRYKSLAGSVQAALEEAVLYLVEHLYKLCPSRNLCYSGGVALNSVANERIINESSFERIYIMPPAEDSGPSIGAAYYGLWQLTGRNNLRKLVHDACGREYSPAEITGAIEKMQNADIVDTENFIAETAELLSQGKIIGWFQGRSELGPRALGQRSILCDPRRPDAKEFLNSRVKHREAFRPFAPVILLEEVGNWFECAAPEIESPFMLRVCHFKEDKKESVPAVVHVDGTGRLQTLTREANGRLYELVCKFHEKTGVPILVNTSFNVMGEPIVETPEDALRCFLSTGIDYCVMQDWLVRKVAH